MESLLTFAGLVLLGVLAVSLGGALMLYHLWFYERQNNDERKALPGASAAPLSLPVGIFAVLVEALCFAFLVLTYPLRIVHDLMPFRAQARGETPILLVHGWGANSACFLVIQLWLKWRGYKNVYAVSYTPPVIDARKLARQLARHIDSALAATGAQKVHIVAHSMGGLLTRYVIRHHGMADRIDKVITLGSPHMGSKLAGMLPGNGNIPQMRYRSAFTTELAEGGMTPGRDVRYYSIYSEFDNFVLPNHSSVLDGTAQNIHVPYHGHVALLYSPVVMGLVSQCLDAPAGAAADSRPR
ncbi:MAG: esterase/lipase family protein [Pseudomonadota bacterium]